MAQHDVVVVGGGNAALCAALAAREAGASVLVVEKAPESQRGGNSFFTAGGFRFAHQGLEDLRRDILPDISEEEARAMVVPPYTENQFYDDLMRVTEGRSDIDMAEFLVKRSRPTIVWMKGQGIRWILMFARQSYQVEGKHRFWGGLNVEAVGGEPGWSKCCSSARPRWASKSGTVTARARSPSTSRAGSPEWWFAPPTASRRFPHAR